MLGREIGKGLITLARKLVPDDNTPADEFRVKVMAWQDAEISLARANDKPERISGITDRAECLLAVLDSANARDAGQVRTLLEKLFARDHGQVTLASIHKAKGLEWDVVLHLDPWRIPSRWAKASGNPRELEQEMNLLYVAETRSKHTLANADLEYFV
jgi:superfamily I DNA/RNA helicase